MRIDLLTASSTVTFLLQALDTDERGDISHSTQPGRYLCGQEMSVGEELEIGIRMTFQEIEQSFIKEWLTT